MPELNDTAPDFTLADTTKGRVSLSDYRGSKVVLVFYPAAFTGVCEAEVCSFRDNMAALNDANAKVIGISVDSPFANGKFKELNGLEFPLLSDITRDVITAYDIVFPGFAGIDGYDVAVRSVFVLDEQGIVTYKWLAPNPGVQPDYAEVVAAVQ